MKTKLYSLWYRLNSSFWFVPTVMVLASILAAFLMLALDEWVLQQPSAKEWWRFQGSLQGAQAFLSTIASSMITVAGVVFSITIVVLSLASSQFGPRLIRNFMNERSNQMVLGTFIATFVYCLLILRSIGGGAETVYAPYLSVHFGLLLTLASLGVLIFFIHGMASSIMASNVIARVCRELEQAIERVFPEKMGDEAQRRGASGGQADIPVELAHLATPVHAAGSGYIQAIDGDGLLGLAVQENLLIQLNWRPGQFISKGSELARIWCEGEMNDSLPGTINGMFILGSERTLEQDVEHAISQLVEIAVRALSPGVNDPLTAITCIDWLGVALGRLAVRKLPSAYRYDDRENLRVVARPFTYGGLADAALNQIRQNGQGTPAVALRMLEMIASVASHVRRRGDRDTLVRHVEMIYRGCRAHEQEPWDLSCMEERYHTALRALRLAQVNYAGNEHLMPDKRD